MYDVQHPDTHNHRPTAVSLDDCPQISPVLSVVRSARTRFFAPSDCSGVTGHKGERVQATPSWRKRAARYDTVLIKAGSESGPHGLSVARLRMLFSFNLEGKKVPTALVEPFSYKNDSPDEDTGMWVLERNLRHGGSRDLHFIPLHMIVRACHLLPVYGNKPVPLGLLPENCLNIFKTFYLSKYADHHAFEILHQDSAKQADQ